MPDSIKKFKERLNTYNKFPFLIKDHARVRAKQRNISINEVLENIITNQILINVERQSNDKYKLTYQKKGSQKQIYIIEFKPEHIELITLWKELSKFQKQINKKWKKN